MLQKKSTVLILGKLPPPLMGPAIATNIILNSNLKNNFNLIHLDTRINKEVNTMGKWEVSKLFLSIKLYLRFFLKIKRHQPSLILIPISQTTLGFLKDFPFLILSARFNSIIQLRGSNFKNWIDSSSFFTKKIVQFGLAKTSGVIVLGENLKYLFHDFYSPNKIYVISNGGDYNFPPKQKNNTKIQLLYIGNFLQSKGFLQLLETIVQLPENNYELNALGAWDDVIYENKCKSFIKKHNLNVTLHLSKKKSEKLQFLANADIFIFTPIKPEGHPWVIVEAMAAGLPIISSNQGAIIESVIHNKNGFIINPFQTKIFKNVLEKLINDKDLRLKMGQQSLEFYKKNYTEEIMIKKYNQLFTSIIFN